MTTSILSRVTPADITDQPFAHLCIENALPDDLFAELEAAFPSLEKVVGDRPMGNNKAYLTNAVDVLPDQDIAEVWRDFFAYHTSDAWFRELLRFWEVPLACAYPDIEDRFGKPLDQVTTGLRRKSGLKTEGNLAADVMMDVQFGINSPVTEVSRVRGPHVDKPQKLIASLLYFRHPDDDSTGGDLGLYKLKGKQSDFNGQYNIDDGYVERVRNVPYRPNTLVMWVNTPNSLHGVSPRSVTNVPRRYVNFIAEAYSLGKEGFFSVHRSLFGRSLSAARRAIGFRDI